MPFFNLRLRRTSEPPYLVDFLFPVDFRRTAVAGREVPEKSTAVDESRFVDDLVDGEFRLHQQALGISEPELLDDRDGRTAGYRPDPVVERRLADPHLRRDVVGRQFGFENVLLDDLQHLVEKVPVLFLQHPALHHVERPVYRVVDIPERVVTPHLPVYGIVQVGDVERQG